MSEEIENAQDILSHSDGWFVGSLVQEELDAFELLCKNGLARRDYSGAGGLMGLAKIKLTPETAEMRCAECDCENCGADCNWIKTPETET